MTIRRSNRHRSGTNRCAPTSLYIVAATSSGRSASCPRTTAISPFSANEISLRSGNDRKIRGMKSYEVIRQAVDEPGVKAVAAALKVSPALVYKWCEQPADSEDPDQS